MQKMGQQLVHLLRLFFSQPVTRFVDQVNSEQTRARIVLHPFERARRLIDPPVTCASNEHYEG